METYDFHLRQFQDLSKQLLNPGAELPPRAEASMESEKKYEGKVPRISNLYRRTGLAARPYVWSTIVRLCSVGIRRLLVC